MKMQKSKGTEGYRRVASAIAVVAAGSLTVSACGNAHPSVCLSPRAVSTIYQGDPNADRDNHATWLTGLEIDTVMPSEAKGLVVGFRPPNADWNPDQDSHPISPDRASTVVVKIGHDAVVFSTQIKAAAGSSVCDKPPATMFGQVQPVQEILQKDATLPTWGP
jgi:hypothetical protein